MVTRSYKRKFLCIKIACLSTNKKSVIILHRSQQVLRSQHRDALLFQRGKQKKSHAKKSFRALIFLLQGCSHCMIYSIFSQDIDVEHPHIYCNIDAPFNIIGLYHRIIVTCKIYAYTKPVWKTGIFGIHCTLTVYTYIQDRVRVYKKCQKLFVCYEIKATQQVSLNWLLVEL